MRILVVYDEDDNPVCSLGENGEIGGDEGVATSLLEEVDREDENWFLKLFSLFGNTSKVSAAVLEDGNDITPTVVQEVLALQNSEAPEVEQNNPGPSGEVEELDVEETDEVVQLIFGSGRAGNPYHDKGGHFTRKELAAIANIKGMAGTGDIKLTQPEIDKMANEMNSLQAKVRKDCTGKFNTEVHPTYSSKEFIDKTGVKSNTIFGVAGEGGKLYISPNASASLAGRKVEYKNILMSVKEDDYRNFARTTIVHETLHGRSREFEIPYEKGGFQVDPEKINIYCEEGSTELLTQAVMRRNNIYSRDFSKKYTSYKAMTSFMAAEGRARYPKDPKKALQWVVNAHKTGFTQEGINKSFKGKIVTAGLRRCKMVDVYGAVGRHSARTIDLYSNVDWILQVADDPSIKLQEVDMASEETQQDSIERDVIMLLSLGRMDEAVVAFKEDPNIATLRSVAEVCAKYMGEEVLAEFEKALGIGDEPDGEPEEPSKKDETGTEEKAVTQEDLIELANPFHDKIGRFTNRVNSVYIGFENAGDWVATHKKEIAIGAVALVAAGVVALILTTTSTPGQQVTPGAEGAAASVGRIIATVKGENWSGDIDVGGERDPIKVARLHRSVAEAANIVKKAGISIEARSIKAPQNEKEYLDFISGSGAELSEKDKQYASSHLAGIVGPDGSVIFNPDLIKRAKGLHAIEDMDTAREVIIHELIHTRPGVRPSEDRYRPQQWEEMFTGTGASILNTEFITKRKLDRDITKYNDIERKNMDWAIKKHGQIIMLSHFANKDGTKPAKVDWPSWTINNLRVNAEDMYNSLWDVHNAQEQWERHGSPPIKKET